MWQFQRSLEYFSRLFGGHFLRNDAHGHDKMYGSFGNLCLQLLELKSQNDHKNEILFVVERKEHVMCKVC